MTMEATQDTTMMANESAHPFEKAGLGKAPFKCVGRYRSIYQAVPGDPNCPIQPGSCCKFCFQGIMDVYKIRSADGQTFEVGCECVRRTGDVKMIAAVKKLANEAARKSRHAREAQRTAAVVTALRDESVRASLASQAHPSAYRASLGGTRLDWAEWMMAHAGASGRMDVAKYLGC